MKLSNKQNVAVGTVLLLLAAFFSIALILQPLDFGVSGPGRDNVFYRLGNMLASVYGFSSILIPLFLFSASISCFASKWTARKSMRFLTAVIPFFTSVIVEKICKIIKSQSTTEYDIIKIILAVIIGLMLVVIEFLGAGVIADKITGQPSKKIKIRKNQKDAETENRTLESDAEGNDKSEDDVEVATENKTDSFTKDNDVPDEASALEGDSNEDAQDIQEDAQEIQSEQNESSNEDNIAQDENCEGEEDDPFEGVFDNIDITPRYNDDKEEHEEVENIYETGLETIFADKNSENEVVEAEAESTVEEGEQNNVLQNDSSQSNAEADFSKDKNDHNNINENEDEDYLLSPASLITREEYASLTNFDDFEYDNEEGKESNDTVENETENETEEKLDDEGDITASEDLLEWPETDEIMAQAGNASSETETKAEIEEESKIEAEDEIEPKDEIKNEDDETDYLYGDSIDYLYDEDEQDEVDAGDSTSQTSKENEDEGLKKNEKINEYSQEEGAFSENNNENVETVNLYEPKPHSDFSDVFDIMEEDIRNELDGKKYTFAAPKEDDETENVNAIRNSAEESEYNENENYESHLENECNEKQDEGENSDPRERGAVFSNQNAIQPKSNRAGPKLPYVISASLLEHYENDQYWIIDEETKADSIKLKETLNQFGIEAEIIGIKKGPVVTMFELSPAPGVKLSKIVALQDNIALNLAASSVRIVAPIPGRAAVGIEVPNKNRSIVSFREMIEQKLSEFEKMAVPVVLGKDILGKPQVLDLVKTPHMLIAGATGAGKSVCVNSMILSILFKRSPQQVKLILIDPKVVELKLYNDIPHLLTPVITEPKRALQSLQYCLCEMERRYALLDTMGVRDIASYNKRIDERNICTEKLPYIVVIIDEFADLMATTGKELESTIARLAAMSRAVGIHLVLATQRPSIDVITGLIKANIPTRIAFMVASKMDSRIIIDQVGAEMLLGKGDMLYASAVDPFPVRIQGTFVSDQDVENVVDYVKTLGTPEYIDDEIFVDDDDGEEYSQSLFNDGPDPLYDQALDIVIQAGKASASYIQRRLKIGYNRAARLVEEMEERGIVGPANGSKPREVIHVPS